MTATRNGAEKGRASLEAHRHRLAQNPTFKDVRDDLAALHATLRAVRGAVEDMHDTLRAAYPFAVPEQGSERKQPYLCPLCKGRKQIQSPWFTGMTGEVVPCPTCGGAGVLWR